MMKKTTRKLVLRKETLRELSSKELSRTIGGLETDADAVKQSGYKQCLTSGLVADAVPQTRDKQCLSA